MALQVLMTEKSMSKPVPFRVADARGLLRLGCDATVGITDLVEQMHLTILQRALPLGRPRRGRTRGITGAVYGSIRGITRLVSMGLDASVRRFERLQRPQTTTAKREAALAAINGIWGDHLAASGNPLAIRMTLRARGRDVDLTAAGLATRMPRPRRRIALLVHGLCMSDRGWQRGGHDHGEMLARELGCETLALNYNSGLHVSDNGERLASLLEQLVAHWPGPVDELVIVGHSMGGLVARAACHAAGRASLAWLKCLTRLVFLGTPHHGAALERGGRLVDAALELSPYAAPFARLGRARSAGITDLRFGNVQRADWEGRDAHDQRHDDRVPTPLPAGVQAYCIAATTSAAPSGLRHAAVGDGLVSLASALGEHRDSRLALAVPGSHKIVVTRAGHFDLLSRPQVALALRRCLA
jgi:pimeloyl-ACP methyl ester carboxylesterase